MSSLLTLWQQVHKLSRKHPFSILLLLPPNPLFLIWMTNARYCQTQWPRELRRESAGSNPAGGINIFSFISVVSHAGRGLFVGLITRPEETYRVRCVWVWSLKPCKGGEGGGAWSGRSATGNKWQYYKNIKPRTTFVSILKLQQLLAILLPTENILYSTASGLTEPSQV